MNKPKSNVRQRLKFLMGLPLILVMLVLFSFQMNGDEKQLVGIWNESEYIVEIPDGVNGDVVLERYKSVHVDRKMTLNEDHTYQIQDPSGVVNGKGVWERDGEILRMTDDQPNVVEYKVSKLDDSDLITEHEVDMETEIGLVPIHITLIYKK